MQGNRGFTLVELVIGIVLIGILSVVSTSMIADSFTTTRIVDASQVSAAQARYALERIAREIHETLYIISSTPGYKIDTSTASKLVFSKCPPVGVVCKTDTYVTVTINNNNNNLTLGYSSPAITSQLSNQVSSFAFTYYDAYNGIAKLASDIRMIEVSLTVKDPSGQSIAQRTRIALRNGA